MQLLSKGNDWSFLVSLVSLMPNSTAWKANPLSFILNEKWGLKDAIPLGARSYKNLLGSQCSKQFDCLCCLKFWPWWHEYHMWDEHPHRWWLTSKKVYGPSCLMIFHQLSTWGSCSELEGSLAFWSFLSCSAISWDLLRPRQDPSSWVIHLQLQVLAQNIKGPKKITSNGGEEKACDFFRWKPFLPYV